jgi:hypothetical protein
MLAKAKQADGPPSDDEISPEVWAFVRSQYSFPTTAKSFYTFAALIEQRHRKAVEAERKRAVAAIHWVFSADGTKTERSMADEAINKINDPSFAPSTRAPRRKLTDEEAERADMHSDLRRANNRDD